jgi:hypothetical protein
MPYSVVQAIVSMQIHVRVEIDNIKGWLFEPKEVELVNEHKEFTDEEYEELLV